MSCSRCFIANILGFFFPLGQLGQVTLNIQIGIYWLGMRCTS